MCNANPLYSKLRRLPIKLVRTLYVIKQTLQYSNSLFYSPGGYLYSLLLRQYRGVFGVLMKGISPLNIDSVTLIIAVANKLCAKIHYQASIKMAIFQWAVLAQARKNRRVRTMILTFIKVN